MAQRPASGEVESAAELARKFEVLEREMAVQREAMDRLERMGATERDAPGRQGVRKPARRRTPRPTSPRPT